MPVLDFTIRTKAELAGAEQGADALERLIGKQKALGEDFTENEAKLIKIRASIAGYGKDVNSSAESVDIFNTHGREMNRLIAEADRALPGAGELLRAAFRPETLGIASTVLIIEEIVKWIGETKKAAEELQKAEEKLVTDTWDAQQKAAAAAATSAQEYSENIKHAGENLDLLKTKSDQQKTLLDARIQQENQLTAALEKQALAIIEANPDLSDKQKHAAAAQVRAAFDDNKSQAETEPAVRRLARSVLEVAVRLFSLIPAPPLFLVPYSP